MRNLKRALSLGLTAAMISGLMVMGSSAASYADVTSEDNQEAIEVLEAVGIMIGDENGNFNPDQNVTRNEMAVVMANLMEYNVASYANTSPFTDVPSWAEPYVAACYVNGITAGTSATTYGGSDTVTTAQAALMLMKALGYFQYNQDFGTDWQLSTVRQGNAIDLFDGVDSGVTDSMTRNDVAQLVLNTLESGMVSATTSGNITVGGVTIATSVEYNYITSNAGYASSISSDRSTDANSDATQPIVELGEDLYQGDLTKEKDHDAFGRPAAIWSYQDDEIGTYVDDTSASWTTKVSERDLYRAAGTSAVNNYDWTVWVNGEVVDDSVNGYDLDRNDTDRWQTTGNGVLTEMFVDTVAETVDVTIIHSYVAEVSRVVANEDDGDYTVTVNFKTRPDGVSVNREFNTETEYAQDDIVIVNIANGSIEAMSLAETVEGTIAAVKDNDYLRIDGTTYNYNYAYTTGNLLAGYSDTNKGLYDLENSTPANPGAGDEVIVYLDGNGSAVAIADAGEVAEDYIYVKGAHELYGDYSARVVYYDGTQEDIDIDEVDNTDNFKYAGAETEYDEAQELGIGVYKFSRSGNAYDLSSSEAANPEFRAEKMANFKIENGRARIGEYIGGAYTGTVYSVGSNTVFVDAYNNTAYTGYQNVPTMNDVEGWIVFDGTGTVADIVFITEDVQYEADNDSFFLVTSSGAEEEYNENGNVYNYTVWINGAEETLTASSRLRNLTVGLWKITQYDSNGRVSDVEQVLDENDLLNVGATSTACATVANYTGLTVANAAISDKSVDDVLDANNRFTIDDETLFVVAYLNDDNTEIDDSSITAVAGPSGLGDINVVDANNLQDNETSAVYILNVDDVDEVALAAKLILVINPDPESGSQGGNQNGGYSNVSLSGSTVAVRMYAETDGDSEAVRNAAVSYLERLGYTVLGSISNGTGWDIQASYNGVGYNFNTSLTTLYRATMPDGSYVYRANTETISTTGLRGNYVTVASNYNSVNGNYGLVSTGTAVGDNFTMPADDVVLVDNLYSVSVDGGITENLYASGATISGFSGGNWIENTAVSPREWLPISSTGTITVGTDDIEVSALNAGQVLVSIHHADGTEVELYESIGSSITGSDGLVGYFTVGTPVDGGDFIAQSTGYTVTAVDADLYDGFRRVTMTGDADSLSNLTGETVTWGGDTVYTARGGATKYVAIGSTITCTVTLPSAGITPASALTLTGTVTGGSSTASAEVTGCEDAGGNGPTVAGTTTAPTVTFTSGTAYGTGSVTFTFVLNGNNNYTLSVSNT